MIKHPYPKELTQGTIFTCGISDDYTDVSVYGIVITARCDVAQGKAPVISYVPLVPYSAWLLRDGSRIVSARALAAANGAIKAALRDAGFAESILHTIPLDDISVQLNNYTERSKKAIANRFDNAVDEKKRATTALSSLSRTSTHANYINSQQKIYNSLVQELLSNTLSDFHFIERSEPDEDCDGYVALLREIRYMPFSLASRLVEGISYEDFLQLCANNDRLRDKINIQNSDYYAMPTGILQSPFIELFMQRLSMLFTRIGVADYSQEKLRTLRSLVPLSF